MHAISMNKAMRDESIILLKARNGNGIKNQPPHECAILPSDKADDDGDDDYGGGVIHDVK